MTNCGAFVMEVTLLLQINGRLPVEALVFSLHVGEAGEVVRVDKGQVHLTQRDEREGVSHLIHKWTTE